MEERQPRPRVQIDPELAATIFISIGRNRRVFPRDLVGLLVGGAGLDRDRIGDIRVLANYSFVQLFKEDAERLFLF
ncbi:MAG: DbpA RNA binding domain-containing protein [Treponema sp.]|nr:MAG: DbpA RNA binding domain-containing protein [Treponema sp.]